MSMPTESGKTQKFILSVAIFTTIKALWEVVIALTHAVTCVKLLGLLLKYCIGADEDEDDSLALNYDIKVLLNNSWLFLITCGLFIYIPVTYWTQNSQISIEFVYSTYSLD